jgi:nitrate reductase molybdenum cofactor assembly chaperone NarJ/NarW
MKTLKVIAALLHYPEADLQAAGAELQAAVAAEAAVGEAGRARLLAFIDELCGQELMEAQGRYCEVFDRGRSVSLHLFEHVHGESRDRGQAMVDLLELYKQHGFQVALSELPDYIPLFLEFCANLPREQAVGWLKEVGHILQLLHARLRERGTPYAVLFEPLLELAELEQAPAEVRAQVQREGRDDTPEALDEAWAEEPVSFAGMPGGAACGGTTTTVQPVRWADPHKAGSTIPSGE